MVLVCAFMLEVISQLTHPRGENAKANSSRNNDWDYTKEILQQSILRKENITKKRPKYILVQKKSVKLDMKKQSKR